MMDEDLMLFIARVIKAIDFMLLKIELLKTHLDTKSSEGTNWIDHLW